MPRPSAVLATIASCIAPCIACLISAWLTLGVASPSLAQDQTTARVTQESNFQAWRLTCLSNTAAAGQGNAAASNLHEGCSISTRFDLLKTNADGQEHKDTLLVFSITRAPDGHGHVAVFSLPLGVYLPSGMAMVFDGQQSLRLAFETCNQTGCHAGLRLTGELEDLLGSSERLEIMFNNKDQRTLKLPLYLAGFESARQALAAALAQGQFAS